MRKELQQELFEQFDRLFCERHLSPKETCMCWGIDTGDGWFTLIKDLCCQLVMLEKAAGIEIKATQVKEKFGTLRFYYSISYPDRMNDEERATWREIVHAVCWNAEHKSQYRCQDCGKRGDLKSTNGWYATLCDQCRTTRN